MSFQDDLRQLEVLQVLPHLSHLLVNLLVILDEEEFLLPGLQLMRGPVVEASHQIDVLDGQAHSFRGLLSLELWEPLPPLCENVT
jgi:hypothetical protein